MQWIFNYLGMGNNGLFILTITIAFVYAICGYVKKDFWSYIFSLVIPNPSWIYPKADTNQYIIALLLSLGSTALFLRCIADYYHVLPDFNMINNAIIFTIPLFVGLECRKYLCRIVGILSKENELFKLYSKLIVECYRLVSACLFVFSIMFLYAHYLPHELWIILSITTVIVVLIIRYVRLFALFSQRSISFFYFILYLCGLEILPLLVVVHTISKVV